MGTLDFGGISLPRNQLTTKTRFWVQRAPSQSLPGKLEVRSRNQKKRKKHAWVEHFTPPQTTPFTCTFRFVHVGWCHRRNHPCQVSSQSVQQFLLASGSKFTISHRLGEWLLQQCYALTCYTVMSVHPLTFTSSVQRVNINSCFAVILSFTIRSNVCNVCEHCLFKTTKHRHTMMHTLLVARLKFMRLKSCLD